MTMAARARIRDPRARFDAYTDKTGTCWLWQGVLTYDGYGLFRHNNRVTGAHRWAYEFAIGPIPDGYQVDHLCRVRHCVNPAHLEAVTPKENTVRGYRDRGGRRSLTVFPRCGAECKDRRYGGKCLRQVPIAGDVCWQHQGWS